MKKIDTSCINCGYPYKLGIRCPLCSSIGGWYPVEILSVGSVFLVLSTLILSVISIIGAQIASQQEIARQTATIQAIPTVTYEAAIAATALQQNRTATAQMATRQAGQTATVAVQLTNTADVQAILDARGTAAAHARTTATSKAQISLIRQAQTRQALQTATAQTQVISSERTRQVSITTPTFTPESIEQLESPRYTSQIAFHSQRDGNTEIYLANDDGSQQTRLTDHPNNDMYPHLSPDGRYIVFNSDRDDNWEIYKMSISGRNQIRLTNNSSIDRLPVWSPDGQRIAFTSDRYGTANIYIIDTDGDSLTQLTFSTERLGHPTWSPDGNYIVFNSGPKDAEDEWELYRVPSTGGVSERLTYNTVIDWGPSWSPIHQNKMVFLSKRPDNADVYLLNTTTGVSSAIFNGPNYEWGAVWSHNGQRIAFTSTDDNTDSIYTMKVDGTDVRRIIRNGAYPSWSVVNIEN